jgi:hypothetical protein
MASPPASHDRPDDCRHDGHGQQQRRNRVVIRLVAAAAHVNGFVNPNTSVANAWARVVSRRYHGALRFRRDSLETGKHAQPILTVSAWDHTVSDGIRLARLRR